MPRPREIGLILLLLLSSAVADWHRHPPGAVLKPGTDRPGK
ncbi:MAG: hypothetical protein ABFS86_17140 [Planctomycetota bacterium]